MKKHLIMLGILVLTALAGREAFAGKPAPPPPPPATAAVKAVCVPWNGADLTAPHPVVSGANTTVKAVGSSGIVKYRWEYGDGTSSGDILVAGLPAFDNYAIAAKHIYTGAVGTKFPAKLTVFDSAGLSSTSIYNVQIVDNTLQARTNMAIDEALWWQHTHLDRYDYKGNPAWPCASLQNGEWNPGIVTDAFALQGYERQGHLLSGSAAANPYVDDVARLVNGISRWIFVKNVQPLDNGTVVDTNGDGVMMGTAEDHVEYEPGVVLKALIDAQIDAKRPLIDNAAYNFTGDSAKAVTNYTWSNVIRNMIDYIAWAQIDRYPMRYTLLVQEWPYKGMEPSKDTSYDNVTNPLISSISRGSWGYFAEGWWDPTSGAKSGWGDIALAYWMTTGLRAAEARGFTVPSSIKEGLSRFVSVGNGIQKFGDPLDINYGAVYFGPNNPNVIDPGTGLPYGENFYLVERAAELLAVLDYLGVPQTDPRAAAALTFIDRNWNRHNYDMRQSHPNPSTGNILGQSLFYLKRTDDSDLDTRYTGWNWSAFLADPRSYGQGIGHGFVRFDTQGANYNFFHPYQVDTTTPIDTERSPGYAMKTPFEPAQWLADGFSDMSVYAQGPSTSILWGWEDGRWVLNADNTVATWTPVRKGDDLNIFALFAVAEAMRSYDIPNGAFPSVAAEPLGWENRITTLLTTNQLVNGGFDEQNWVSGSPFGTPWALMTMTVKGNHAVTTPFAFTTSATKTSASLTTKVTVRNETGAVLPGATVTGMLANATATLRDNWVATTDTAGVATFTYSAKTIPAGTYTFTVKAVEKANSVWTQAPGPLTGTYTK